MVHFLDSSSTPNKPTLTILDREDDPIEEGVTLRVDMPTPLSSKCSLLHNYLADSCWSVESTRDIQRSDGVISFSRVLNLNSPLFAYLTLSQEAAPLLWHRIMDETLSWGNFSSCFSHNFFVPYYWEWLEDVLGPNKKKDLWNVGSTMDCMHPCSPTIWLFLSILRTIVPYYQHLLHRERWHVYLFMGFVGYRWTSSWRCLLRRSHSICQRTPFCETWR